VIDKRGYPFYRYRLPLRMYQSRVFPHSNPARAKGSLSMTGALLEYAGEQ
jgi:hypothetical protein